MNDKDKINNSPQPQRPSNGHSSSGNSENRAPRPQNSSGNRAPSRPAQNGNSRPTGSRPAQNSRPDGSRPAQGSGSAPSKSGKPVTTKAKKPVTAPKTKDASGKKKKKKKHSKVFNIIKKLITVIMTTLLSLVLIMIITGTIVCTALTVYVLDFMEETTGITLQELESGSNTYFYGMDTDEETGNLEYVVLHSVQTDVQRIPVSIDEIPQHVRDAFVYTEDERFYTHDGVDYKRTFSAFLNMFLNIYDTEQGGSTITQQLVKNLTGDKEHSPQRKIREIFRAMQLEKTYSKDEILEEYLNYIGFGGPINGIQLAANRYFGKNVNELSTAEAATLAAIPKSPNEYYPFNQKYDEETGAHIYDGKAVNKERQQYVLWQLYKNGAISYDEYQVYLDEKLVYTDSEEYLKLHPEDAAEELEKKNEANSWVVDAMYKEAAEYLCTLYNIDYWEAIRRINNGGYKIYSCVNFDMQSYVEEKFLDLGNILDVDKVRKWADIDGDGESEEYLPHVAFTALDYDGTVLCTVGQWGEKKDSFVTNYATTEKRQIGSTIKPISTYGLALETDMIHWGSTYRDEAVLTLEDGRKWPTNYSTDGSFSVSGQTINVYYAIQKSYNTVPAKLCDALTPNSVFNFCKDKLGMDLDRADEAYSPLSVGALTYGLTLENLVNAYLPYGNEGIYYDAHIVTKIEQNNQPLYENNGNPRQAVSEETAWVMNRLLKNVVETGTGTAARLDNKVVCGKTGTTNDWYDLTFVGLTKDFVSGVTIGYKYYNKSLSLPASVKSAKVWNNIIGEYANSLPTGEDFEPVETVTSAPMCTASGMIAGSNCPKGIIGYWKSTNAPVCTGGHVVEPEVPTDENGQPITEPATQDPNEQPPVITPADPNVQPPAVTPEQPTDPPVVTPEQPADPPADTGGDAAAPAA